MCIITRSEFLHANFIELLKIQFKGDPTLFHIPEGIKIRFFNSDKQNNMISNYIKQQGSSPEGLGYILSRCDINDFHKNIEKVQ